MPIFDFRLSIDGGTIRQTTLSIDNRHSSIRKELPIFDSGFSTGNGAIRYAAPSIDNRQSSIGNVEGGYHVFCPVLPGCHAQGETIDESIRNIHEAIRLYIDSLVEDGLPVPEEDIFIKPIEIPA